MAAWVMIIGERAESTDTEAGGADENKEAGVMQEVWGKVHNIVM